jgi:hypothetical protein
VAQEVVHDLEAVEVDHHDGGLAARVEAALQLGDQGPSVRQARQFVVVRVVAGALLGLDPPLELDKHRRHGLQCVDLRAGPIVKVEVQEAEDSPRHVTE